YGDHRDLHSFPTRRSSDLDEVHVELDDVAEPVAGRTRAERVVEREQPRLRILVRDAAATALEAFAEPVSCGLRIADCGLRIVGCGLLNGPGCTTAFEIRR